MMLALKYLSIYVNVWCWKESSCAIVGFKIFYLNNFVSFYFMLPDHFFPERSAVLDPQHWSGQSSVKSASSGRRLCRRRIERHLLRRRIFVRVILSRRQVLGHVHAATPQSVVVEHESTVLCCVARRVPTYWTAGQVHRAANLKRFTCPEPELPVLLDDGVRRDRELRRALASARVWRRVTSVSRVVIDVIVRTFFFLNFVSLFAIRRGASFRRRRWWRWHRRVSL